MPSYSSSNIDSIRSVANLNTVGARLLTTISRDADEYSVENGLSAGHVVRYDPGLNRYVTSLANDPANAEVFGVVESITGSNLNVVLYGMMNYPDTGPITLRQEKDEDGVTGGAGGEDVYFLSGNTSGVLQALAPNNPGYIVKPVVQKIKTPGFNAQVLNYVGYIIGGEEISSEVGTEPPGALIYSMTESDSYNWKRCDIPLTFVIADYRDLYNALIGSSSLSSLDERIYVNTPPDPGLIGSSAIQQTNGKITWSGQVVGASTLDNYYDIRKFSDAAGKITGLADSSGKITIGSGTWTISSNTNYGFTTPIFSRKTETVIVGQNTQRQIELYPYLKVSSTSAVSIPSSVTVEKLTVTDTATIYNQSKTGSPVDLYDKLTALDTHKATVESTLNLT